MREILTKTFFSPQSEPHTAKLCFSVVLKHFWGNSHRELVFLDKKVTILERSTELLRKFVYLNMFEKGQILRKIWICLNDFFLLNSKRGQIFFLNVFLPKVSHIQINYAFLLF